MGSQIGCIIIIITGYSPVFYQTLQNDLFIIHPYLRLSKSFGRLHDKTNKMSSASSKDTSPPSLIRDFHCLHQETLGPELPTERTAKIRTGYTVYFVGFVTVTICYDFYSVLLHINYCFFFSNDMYNFLEFDNEDAATMMRKQL